MQNLHFMFLYVIFYNFYRLEHINISEPIRTYWKTHKQLPVVKLFQVTFDKQQQPVIIRVELHVWQRRTTQVEG